jgi:hypothetical protein
MRLLPAVRWVIAIASPACSRYISIMSDLGSQPAYRGSSKHKNRPVRGIKGTLCPEWTHRTTIAGLGNDVLAHAWEDTEASRLFEAATLDANGRRYATAKGIAFEAQATEDGAWHGYPIPWNDVPNALRRRWLEEARSQAGNSRGSWHLTRMIFTGRFWRNDDERLGRVR